MFEIETNKVFHTLKVIGDNELEDIKELDFIYNDRILRWSHNRIAWDEHLSKIVHQNRFRNEYELSYEAFINLIDILTPEFLITIKGY